MTLLQSFCPQSEHANASIVATVSSDTANASPSN